MRTNSFVYNILESVLVKEMIFVYLQEIFHDLKESILKRLLKKRLEKSRQKDYEINRWHSYTQMLIKWKYIGLQNKKISEYLTRNDIRNIAIYGCGDIGKLCCDELLESEEINIIELIDRKVIGTYKNIPIVAPSQISSKVDAVLITPIPSYLEIANVMCRYTEAKFISLEDVITIVDECESGVP